VSGPRGRFVIDGIAPGRIALTIRRIGFTPVHQVVTVPGSGLGEIEIQMVEAPMVLPTVVVDGTRPGIYGTVVLVGERPAVGARVEVLGPSGAEVVADSSGRFAFPTLRQGSYLVRVTLPQFSERRIAVVLPRNGGQELAINLLPSKVAASRADVGALEDLGKRLSFGLRMDRLMRDDLSLRGPMDVCEMPQIRSVVGGPNNFITIIVNGIKVYRNMPVHTLCSWRVDEVEVVEFGPNPCTDVTGSVATLLGVTCPRFGRRVAPPRAGRAVGGTDTGAFVVVWERR